MLPYALFRVAPEDFVVEEIPLYLPSGVGEHLYLHIEKNERTTFDAVAGVARALDVRRDVIGTAGLKDKAGITRQWLSVAVPPRTPDFDARAAAMSLPGIRVLEAKRHENKLRTGHLFGNRFILKLHAIAESDKAAAEAALQKLASEGLPNAYGEQRFGRNGDNVERAKSWIAQGMPRLRDLRDAKFLISALQSGIFNLVLERRVAAGTWNRALEGDILHRERSMPGEPEQRFAQFHVDDVALCNERVRTFEVSATGPMPGVEMLAPTGQVLELEQAATAEIAGADLDWAAVRRFGEGTRRPLRLRVRELAWTWLPAAAPANAAQSVASGNATLELEVAFALPKGAYATTVLGAVFALENAQKRARSADAADAQDEPTADESAEARMGAD